MQTNSLQKHTISCTHSITAKASLCPRPTSNQFQLLTEYFAQNVIMIACIFLGIFFSVFAFIYAEAHIASIFSWHDISIKSLSVIFDLVDRQAAFLIWPISVISKFPGAQSPPASKPQQKTFCKLNS